MTLDEAVAMLVNHPDRDEVVKLLEAKATPVTHAIFQKGHDVGYGKKGRELTDAQTQAATLTSKVQELEGQVLKLRDQNPDVSKLHTQYGEQIAQLQAESKNALTALKTQIKQERERGAQGRLKDQLLGLKVDPDYAQVLTERSDVLQRIQLDDTGAVTIMQHGKSIPIAVQDGQNPLHVLAEELVKSVDPKWLTSDAGPGSGTRPTGLPPTGTGGKANLFATIREQQAKALEAKRTEAKTARESLAGLGLSNATP